MPCLTYALRWHNPLSPFENIPTIRHETQPVSPFGLVRQEGGHDLVRTLRLLRPLLSHEIVRRNWLVHVVHHSLTLENLLFQERLQAQRRRRSGGLRPSCVPKFPNELLRHYMILYGMDWYNVWNGIRYGVERLVRYSTAWFNTKRNATVVVGRFRRQAGRQADESRGIRSLQSLVAPEAHRLGR